MIVLFLTIMIAMILVRALRKDIAAYNNSDPQSKLTTDIHRHPRLFQHITTTISLGYGVGAVALKDLEDNKEESGWKLVHGDVFRPPTAYPMLYSVCVGKPHTI